MEGDEKVLRRRCRRCCYRRSRGAVRRLGISAESSGLWYANANDIADFLAAANPRFWPRDTMRAAMKEHLDETLTEASDELGGNFTASVADYEAVHLHILVMADLLRSGIMRQFPGRFH